MSQENVEIVCQAFDIFNRYGETDQSAADRQRLFEEFAAIATPDFEYREDPSWPGAQVYRGLEKYLPVIEGYFDSLGKMTAEVEKSFDLGDRVVGFVRFWARGTSSGAEAEMRPGQVFTLREGKIAKQEIYLNRHEALEAVGLSE